MPTNSEKIDPALSLSEYFGDFQAGSQNLPLHILRHPVQAVGAIRDIGRLAVVDARIEDDGDAGVVVAGLKRPHRFARRLIRGTTAVLELTDDYTAGSSESKRSLRTKYNRAKRRGFRIVRPLAEEDRREILDLANEYERTQPHEHYRNENPDNDYLLDLPNWLVATDAEGTPLLLAVPAVSGQWAVLQHFKTMSSSDDAKLARFWMSVELVTELRAIGVRYLADTLSPIGLPPGLREFQRRLGYRLVRVNVDERQR